MGAMRYTIQDFNKEFPNDDVCLDHIFYAKNPGIKGYYRIKGRKSYANAEGQQIHPLSGTIFEKSSTSLHDWFYAIFLFAHAKNGVSAKELQRQLGVTYKTAWRMGYQIRKLMEQDGDLLSGELEADETYYGKKGRSKTKFKNKQTVLGVVERQGRVRVQKAPNRRTENVLPFIKNNVEKGSFIVTDEYSGYRRLWSQGYPHMAVKHGKGHYTWKGQNTNTIEGFWGQFKRSVRGTYAFVSPQHLQSYLNEFAFRYNHRISPTPIFLQLLSKVSR